MELIQCSNLTSDQKEAVLCLTRLCSRTDKQNMTAETEPDPDCFCFFYLLEEKTNPDCPAAFLSCMLLKDGDEVLPDATFTLHVRPDVRRQGIAAGLYRTMVKECQTVCRAERIRIHTCAAPGSAGYFAASAMGFRTDASHLLMNLSLPAETVSADTFPCARKSGCPVTLRPCRNRRILASLYHRIFLFPVASARFAVRDILDMPQTDTFVLFQDSKAVGLAMILTEGNGAYLFNFGILPEYRRKHLATAMFRSLLSFLPESVRNIQLQVDRENTAALLLYEKLGFRTVTELLELSTLCYSSVDDIAVNG